MHNVRKASFTLACTMVLCLGQEEENLQHSTASDTLLRSSCAAHVQAVDIIIAEELQRQEYAAAWEDAEAPQRQDYAAAWADEVTADGAAKAAKITAALSNLGMLDQHSVPAPQAARSDEVAPAPMDVDEAELQPTGVEQWHTLWHAYLGPPEPGVPSACAAQDIALPDAEDLWAS